MTRTTRRRIGLVLAAAALIGLCLLFPAAVRAMNGGGPPITGSSHSPAPTSSPGR